MIDAVITLISKSYTQNEAKAIVETESTRDVMCMVKSVGRSDFYQAQQMGLDLSFVFITNPVNYEGESMLEYEGQRYGITRTYRASQDVLEIYAGTKVGAYHAGSNEGSQQNTP